LNIRSDLTYLLGRDIRDHVQGKKRLFTISAANPNGARMNQNKNIMTTSLVKRRKGEKLLYTDLNKGLERRE